MYFMDFFPLIQLTSHGFLFEKIDIKHLNKATKSFQNEIYSYKKIYLIQYIIQRRFEEVRREDFTCIVLNIVHTHCILGKRRG